VLRDAGIVRAKPLQTLREIPLVSSWGYDYCGAEPVDTIDPAGFAARLIGVWSDFQFNSLRAKELSIDIQCECYEGTLFAGADASTSRNFPDWAGGKYADTSVGTALTIEGGLTSKAKKQQAPCCCPGQQGWVQRKKTSVARFTTPNLDTLPWSWDDAKPPEQWYQGSPDTSFTDFPGISADIFEVFPKIVHQKFITEYRCWDAKKGAPAWTDVIVEWNSLTVLVPPHWPWNVWVLTFGFVKCAQ
jgi:hypothetical protein